MAKVFLSYKRVDEAFVRRLDQALRDHGHETWVDLTGIPPTAVFMERIRAGIEGADAFVAVLTPEMVTAEVCGQEVEHAVRHNKRLIPIVLRDVDRRAVPPALGERHWIFFRERDDFAASLSTLLAAIATDLEWVETHTRLTVRATEWQSRRRDPSYLLGGSDLTEAEAALVRAGEGTQPQPTPLQQEYVLASRAGTTRFQRRLLIGVTTALAVTVVLAVVAFWQSRVAEGRRQEAVREKKHAQQETRFADARRLAAESTTALALAPERALLLAAEAVRATRRDEPRVLAAEQALRDALATAGGRPLGRAGTIRYVALGAGGSTLVAALHDGSVLAWDLDHPDSEPVTYRDRRQPVVLNGVAVSADGRRLAALSQKVAWAWDRGRPGPPLAELAGTDGKYTSTLALAPDGHFLAAAWSDGSLRVIDLSGANRPRALAGHAMTVEVLRFLPVGHTLLSASRDGHLKLWNLDTPDAPPGEKRVPVIGIAGEALAISGDGRWLATAPGWGGVWYHNVWNLGDLAAGPIQPPYEAANSLVRPTPGTSDAGELSRSQRSPRAGSYCVALSADGRVLAYGGGGGTVFVRSVDQPLTRAILLGHHDEGVASLTFVDDGRRLVSAGGSTIQVWDLRNPGGQATILRGYDGRVVHGASSPDGRRIVAATYGTARVWDLAASPSPAAQPRVSPGHVGISQSLEMSPDGHRLATAGGDVIRVRDLRAPETPPVEFRNVGAPNGYGEVLAFSADGRRLGVVTFNEAHVFDLDRPDRPPARYLVAEDKERADETQTLAFSDDGRRLAAATLERSIVWDLDRPGPPWRVLPGTRLGVHRLSFAPGGRRLIRWDEITRSPVLVWDLEHPETAPAEIRQSELGLARTVVSQDGRRILIQEPLGKRAIWIRDGAHPDRAAQPLPSADRLGLRLWTLTSDGRYLAAHCADTLVRVWDLSRPAEPPRAFLGQDGDAKRLALSHDGRIVAATDAKNVLRVWDRAEPSALPVVLNRDGEGIEIHAIAVSPDHRRVFAACDDGLLRTWDLRVDDLLALAARTAGRNLGIAEWRQTFPGRPYRPTLVDLPPADDRASYPPDVARNLTLAEWAEEFPGRAYQPTFAKRPFPAYDPEYAAIATDLSPAHWARLFPNEPYRRTFPNRPRPAGR